MRGWAAMASGGRGSAILASCSGVNLFGTIVMVLRFGLGLVGDECEDESSEEGDAEAGSQHDVARCEGCFEFGFGFVVHGFEV